MKVKKISPSGAHRILKKIRKQLPYSNLFNYSINHIWNNAVQENGWWDKRELSNELLASIYFEVVHRNQTFHERLKKDNRHIYTSFLLKNTEESDEELKQIISNARSRTMERYLNEIGKKRKPKEKWNNEFEQLYEGYSPEAQEAIKVSRTSGINRYETKVVKETVETGPSYKLTDNSHERQLEIELMEELKWKLSDKDKLFICDLLQYDDKELTIKYQIKLESLCRKERRLKEKIKSSLREE